MITIIQILIWIGLITDVVLLVLGMSKLAKKFVDWDMKQAEEKARKETRNEMEHQDDEIEELHKDVLDFVRKSQKNEEERE